MRSQNVEMEYMMKRNAKGESRSNVILNQMYLVLTLVTVVVIALILVAFYAMFFLLKIIRFRWFSGFN
jgi:hypothetical protein